MKQKEPGPIELCLDDFRAGTIIYDRQGLAWFIESLDASESVGRPFGRVTIYDPARIVVTLERAPWEDKEEKSQ